MFERIESDPRGSGCCRGTIAAETPGRFEVLDQGAQITAWNPPGARDVLFCSDRAVRDPGVPLRGGIPLCFPWFGNGRRGHQKPSHGFARTTPWRLVRAQETGSATTLTWGLSEEDLLGRVAGAPHHFHTELEQTLGEQLTLKLRVRNTGDHDSFVVETALHSYFRVADVRQVEVHGLGGSEFSDRTDGVESTQIGPVTFPGEVDRIFTTRARTTIVDPVWGRRIVIDKSGSGSTVVWNPGAQKAAALEDLGDAEYRDFVCVEPGNVRSQAIGLHPGEQHELSVRISIHPLQD